MRALLLLPLVLVAGCGGSAAGSALRFADARTDLGTIYQHEERVFSLPFTLEGDAPVRIDLIDTSCGCTDVRLVVNGETLLWAERKGAAPKPDAADESLTAKADRLIELPAGTRGEVMGTFRAENKLGERVVAVTLAGSMLNSPAKTEIRVNILPVFDFPKDAASFGTLLQSALGDGGLSRDIAIKAPREFRVKQWRNVPEGVSVELLEGATPAGEQVVQTLRVRLAPGLPIGPPKQYTFTGETDLNAPLEMVVSWRIVGPAVYYPDHRVQFINVQNGREHTQQVKIRPFDAKTSLPEPRVELLGETAGVLTASVEPLPASGTDPAGWLARIKLPQGTAPGVYNGTLRISYPDGSGLTPWEMVVYARVQEAR